MKKKPINKKPVVLKPKKKINSRTKGKCGELEFAEFLRAYGVPAKRGQQFKGGTDSPDVVAGGSMSNIHIEVKRVQKGNIYPWLDQACKDADICKIPVVAHRKNNRRWVAIMDMRDFINFMEMLYAQYKP